MVSRRHDFFFRLDGPDVKAADSVSEIGDDSAHPKEEIYPRPKELRDEGPYRVERSRRIHHYSLIR